MGEMQQRQRAITQHLVLPLPSGGHRRQAGGSGESTLGDCLAHAHFTSFQPPLVQALLTAAGNHISAVSVLPPQASPPPALADCIFCTSAAATSSRVCAFCAAV